MQAEQPDILIVRDSAGAYYAAPLTALHAYQLPDELAPQAAALLPQEEVSGYGHAPAVLQLQAQDRMGNFEIQGLMSEYSRAEMLTTNVLNKARDAGAATIKNI